jgi:hypothetical protein
MTPVAFTGRSKRTSNRGFAPVRNAVLPPGSRTVCASLASPIPSTDTATETAAMLKTSPWTNS